MTSQNESHAERGERLRGLAATARLAAAKAEGQLLDTYMRLAAKWDRLADEAEALVVAHAIEVTENPLEHREAALKLTNEDEPQNAVPT